MTTSPKIDTQTPADLEVDSWREYIYAARRGAPIKPVSLAQLILETPSLEALFVNKALFQALRNYTDRSGKPSTPNEETLYRYAKVSETDKALLDALAHSLNHMIVDDSRSNVNMPHQAFSKGKGRGFDGSQILSEALRSSFEAVNHEKVSKWEPEIITKAFWEWRKTVKKHLGTSMNAYMLMGE